MVDRGTIYHLLFCHLYSVTLPSLILTFATCHLYSVIPPLYYPKVRTFRLYYLQSMIHSLLLDTRASGKKLLAVLIDPDKAKRDNLKQLAEFANNGQVDVFLWGGSLVNTPQAEYYLKLLKSHLDNTPVILFPGSTYQLDPQADGLLLLSLLSGRNPDLLIGRHVQVAGRIKRMNIDAVATGYLLIDGGKPTSVSYMSNTTPIPADKPSIAAATALAGEQLGMKLIYMDAGSGAQHPVSSRMITCVRQEVDLPIVVGGGIRTPQRAAAALEAGADMIVVGNGLEKDPSWLPELAATVRALSQAEQPAEQKSQVKIPGA